MSENGTHLIVDLWSLRMSSDATEIAWTTVFLDFPVSQVAAGTAFWVSVTGGALSDRRGDRHQFVTVLPSDGDAYLRVQTVPSGPPGTHLDLHSGDQWALARRAEQLGATVVSHQDDLVVLRSPGGYVFCAVGWDGERRRPGPLGRPGAASTLDQLCLDIPADSYDEEVQFWSTLTGWELGRGDLAEFRWLRRPRRQALRLLLQRLDSPAASVTGHLDLAADDVDHEVARHVALGADLERRLAHWTTLVDPAGLPYCITHRRASG